MGKVRITISIDRKLLKKIDKKLKEVDKDKLPRRSRSSFMEKMVGNSFKKKEKDGNWF